MHINYTPTMTMLLVNESAFAREPFTLVDVGALGGIQGHWAAFGKYLRVIAFEPNEVECRRLQQTGDPRVTYLPFGLGARDEARRLYIHRNPSSSSIFPYTRSFTERFIGPETTEVVGEETIHLRCMDDVLADVGDIDFVKLDAEGAEHDIMTAGHKTLSSLNVLGLMSEIRFHKGHSGTPVFWEIERLVREMGYELYDLELGRTSRKELPYPLLYDYRHDTDYQKKIFGGTISGQVLGGDALYLRDYAVVKPPTTPTKVLKLACLFEIFEHVDSAAELILAFRTLLDPVINHRRLLDALVPTVRGQKLPYDEYVKRYFAHDPMFRPTVPGKRFPEPIVASYDGTFQPPWEAQPAASVHFIQRARSIVHSLASKLRDR